MKRRLSLGVLTVVLLCSGCGISPQSAPRSLPPRDVPFGLLQTAQPRNGAPLGGQTTSGLWLVRHGHLVEVRARVPFPGRPDQLIRSLLGGAALTLAGAGVRTAIPEGTRLLSFDLSGTVADLDLSPEFTQAKFSDQILAVAQLVYTATEGGRVRAVIFSVHSQSIEIPGVDGSLTSGPVGRANYRALLGG